MIEDYKGFVLINERFPHVGKRLKLFWGEPEFMPYIEALKSSARGKDMRKGFPQDVTEALFELTSLHERQYPGKTVKRVTVKADMWDPWS